MKLLVHSFLVAASLVYQDSQCLASDPRDHYNYELKRGRKVVYRGSTNDLERREQEHARDGKKFTHMRKVGRAKTRKGALSSEEKSLKRYRKNHGGRNPQYNQTNHG